MKTLKLFLLSFSLFLAIPFAEGQTVQVPSEIIAAFNKGDAAKLSEYFNDNVELFIDNNINIFSKRQATGIISDFFRKNHVTSFQLIHKGTKEASVFAIGMLKTASGSFRVNVLIRKDEIIQLRIEPSND